MKIVLTEKTNFSILFTYKAIAVTLKNRSFFVIPQIKVPERTLQDRDQVPVLLLSVILKTLSGWYKHHQ